ncbi:MAG: hypothetical protein P4L51_28440 [Puia sp.]|nr:hypothetical protein [Puia sp.]
MPGDRMMRWMNEEKLKEVVLEYSLGAPNGELRPIYSKARNLLMEAKRKLKREKQTNPEIDYNNQDIGFIQLYDPSVHTDFSEVSFVWLTDNDKNLPPSAVENSETDPDPPSILDLKESLVSPEHPSKWLGLFRIIDEMDIWSTNGEIFLWIIYPDPRKNIPDLYKYNQSIKAFYPLRTTPGYFIKP